MGDGPRIFWKANTAGCKKSKVYVERIVDNFLTQGIKKLAKGGTLLELILTNKESVRKVKVGGSFG